MYIEVKKTIKVQNGYFCGGCSQLRSETYGNKTYHYCEVNGEFLEQSADGRFLKNNTCFENIRKELIKRGK